MKLIKHPNVVQLHEVLASKTKIYIIHDYVDDSYGVLKVSCFGLSAFAPQVQNGMLHTACGTPNYVAPEVQFMRRNTTNLFEDVVVVRISRYLKPVGAC
ncbi:CBL-interacting protein kinase 9-like isoform X2 [Carex rostrata]